MAKPGRNDPCPCGSGKKYKHCCGINENIIPFPGTENINDFDETFEPWDDNFEEYSSIDLNVNSLIGRSAEKLNNTPQRDFLGLTASQMFNILNLPFEENTDIVTLTPKIVLNDIKAIPFMEQALFFLEHLRELQPLPATKIGNLPRSFVQLIYDKVIRKHVVRDFGPPQKEGDVFTIMRLRYVLIFTGLIRKYKKAFSLTRKATKLLDNHDWAGLFAVLFRGNSIELVWDSEDGYPELWIIQRALIFDLYILKKLASKYVAAGELAQAFTTAFPTSTIDFERNNDDPEDDAKSCFRLRFLQRYAYPMGFIVRESTPKFRLSHIDEDVRVKTTDTFERLFSWKV